MIAEDSIWPDHPSVLHEKLRLYDYCVVPGAEEVAERKRDAESAVFFARLIASNEGAPAGSTTWKDRLTEFFNGAFAVAGDGAPIRARLLARKLGQVFPVLAALAAGGFTAHKIATAIAVPTVAKPQTTFNIVSESCDSAPVQREIKRLEENGFKLTCRVPSPSRAPGGQPRA